MGSVPHRPHLIEPAVGYIAAALRLSLMEDPKGQYAVDRALELLQAGASYEFDGSEMRVSSFSRGHDVVHVTNGHGCTCEGGVRPWCRHRALFRLLLAYAALRDPVALIDKICEQEVESVVVAPAVPFEALQAAVDEFFE